MKLRKNLNLEVDLKMIFKEEVYNKMASELVYSFLSLMEEERKGEFIDFSIMKYFTKFMTTIEVSYMESLYMQDLENLIIDSAIKFYGSIIQEMFNNNTYLSYLKWGIDVLISEENRLEIYLPQNTIKRIIAHLKEIIFFSQSKVLLESIQGFKFLLGEKNITVITQYYI
jgi:hypothetical protein